jgi:hypothetical protein
MGEMKAKSWNKTAWVICLSLCAAPSLVGGDILPNPGFEDGIDKPAGWQCGDGGAVWSDVAHRGKHSFAVKGNGTNSFFWRTEPLKLQPGGLYRLRYHGRRDDGAIGGCAVSGIGRVNRDFRFDESWRPYGFIFSAPDDDASDYVRFGQWETKGTLYFDDAQLSAVQAAHAPYVSGSLGEAESVRNGVYRFQPDYAWPGANYHRPLAVNRCGFNSDRWTFQTGSELVYRHQAPGSPMTGARIALNLNYYTAGKLRVEASTNGVEWVNAAVFDQNRRSGTNELAASLFPATNILVRLIAEGDGANFQLNRYDFEAPLARPMPDRDGKTSFFEVAEETGAVSVALKRATGQPEDISQSLVFELGNKTTKSLKIRPNLKIDDKDWVSRPDFIVPEGKSLEYALSVEAGAPGRHPVEVRFDGPDGKALFSGQTEIEMGLLAEPRAGYWAGGTDGIQLWWCESGWKIGKNKQWPAPASNPTPIRVSAARGEYEAAQLVICPVADAVLKTVRMGAMQDAKGNGISVDTELNRVDFVHVTHPTDVSGTRGWHPDPLPPLQTPISLAARENLPLWITFHVPEGAKGGDYAGMIELGIDGEILKVPVALHVFDFDLPKEAHLKSAFGLGTGTINQFHQLKDAAQQEAVFERYLANFAAHRIAPYSFFDYAPIDIRFTGEGTNKQAKVDFTRFDRAAEKWLGKFSTFMLPLHGMGGGTFQSRSLGSMEGFQEGTPEHARLFKDYLSQIESHLRERGWLDKAFTYWFDEPDPKDYDFVVAGMKRIKAAAPGIRRMLTEQPEPALFGSVDIWCGLTPEWTPEKVAARRAAGEAVWWYICCAPKAPYVTEFIDHPAVELRLWPWQSWQYGVEGLLVWASTYWTSPSAFPAPKIQDPWEDPMSYVSGYDFGPGHIDYWGNGDGRFLYPPRDALRGGKPNLEAPVNSIRWENLRDGMEDYEYFWLLARAIERREKAGATAASLQEARELLVVPGTISKDLTHFTTDPRPLLAHRERVARMIEKLKR